MKKVIKISMLLVISIMLFETNSNAFTAKTSIDNKEITVGEIITYKIKLDKKVIATNFDISYNAESFEFIGSKTPGLNVSEKEGKVACIYLDIKQQGISEFQLEFKSKKSSKEETFSIENVKFRVAGQKESYTLKNTIGLEEQIVKINDTMLTKLMWIVIIGIGTILIAIITFFTIEKLKTKFNLVK